MYINNSTWIFESMRSITETVCRYSTFSLQFVHCYCYYFNMTIS